MTTKIPVFASNETAVKLDSERKVLIDGVFVKLKSTVNIVGVDSDGSVLTMKCRRCDEVKPFEEFQDSKGCALGKSFSCKDCVRAASKKWSLDNKEQRDEDSRNRARAGKMYAIAKFGNKCGDCGNTFPVACYDFHHTDGSDKEANPSKFFRMSKERLDNELNKCVMLCANCHRVRHYGDRMYDN